MLCVIVCLVLPLNVGSVAIIYNNIHVDCLYTGVEVRLESAAIAVAIA